MILLVRNLLLSVYRLDQGCHLLSHILNDITRKQSARLLLSVYRLEQGCHLLSHMPGSAHAQIKKTTRSQR